MENEKECIDTFLKASKNESKEIFLKLLKDYKKTTKRLNKILTQSDRQQFHLLKLNEQLEEYKKKLETKIESDKILFQKARQAQMGDMLSMIAHQWRQPLASLSSTIISMQLDIINPKYDLDNKRQRDEFFAQQQQKFDKIVKQFDMLSSTIDDFKNFFKPTKEKNHINIDIPIKQALSILDVALKQSNTKIKLNIQKTDKINIHQNEITQVIINIIQNSIDNFGLQQIKNPLIQIDIYQKNNKICVDILDNGGGIDENIIPKIFDPYFSTKSEKNGTGIGLYMSKMIIEEHNFGTLDMFNKQDGVCARIIWDTTTN